MGLTLVTDATAEPITLAEAKAQLRVDSTAEDSLLTRIMSAARSNCEFRNLRQYVTATWKQTLDYFPCGRCIKLPLPPLQAVSSITYYDSDGTQQTWDSNNYTVDTANDPGRICLAPSVSSWPSTQYGRANAVEITFTCGYGDPADVPTDIKSAILLTVGHLYENRESVVLGTIATTLPMAVDSLLSKYDWGGRYG